MRNYSRLRLLAVVALAAACNGQRDRARADSLQAATAEQLELTTTLSAQKDSLTRVIFEADDFIMQIDSQIRTVKGLPAGKRKKESLESPIEEQLLRRKETLPRVAALVERTKATAAQLAESRKRERALKGENEKLQGQIDEDQKMIARLGETIQQQTVTIASLESRVDSLGMQVDSLAAETRSIGTVHYRAYYIVGTERELLEKGVVQREGGANLLIARPGRTLQPARTLNPKLFTAIDQREVREIPLPDSTRQYRIVSRQSLDNADVDERDKSTFRGKLRIRDVEHFWQPSRFLIVVQR